MLLAASDVAAAASCLEEVDRVAEQHGVDLDPGDPDRPVALPEVASPLPSRGPVPQLPDTPAFGNIATVRPGAAADSHLNPIGPLRATPPEDMRAGGSLLPGPSDDDARRVYLLLRRAQAAETRGNSAACFELVIEAQRPHADDESQRRSQYGITPNR